MTRNAAWKNRVRKYAAEHGLTYQQAHEALTQGQAAGPGLEPGRYLVAFDVLGFDHDIEPFTLDVQDGDDLRNQIHDVVAARGWASFWVELDGRVGKVRVNVEPPNADVIGTFTLHPQGDTGQEEQLVELPRSLHYDAHELIDVVQRRLDCTVDAITMVRGKHGDELEHVALAYWAGDREFRIVHISSSNDGLNFTLSDEAWPLARDEEAVEAFQAKVAEHIHA
ncbi:hypothetical protein [Nonomuraea sp. NPDC050786]|uniref:hypothetical protein n=1 Tax=Nonomuraea sp. NPDC050786 TaxID=3154840 RepID=UPI0033D45C2A